MPLNYSELTLRDFSGGITDRYINAPENKLKSATNFLITESLSLKTRPGTKLFFEQDAANRIMGMFSLKDVLHVFRGQQLYYHESGALSLVSLPQPIAPFFQYTSNTSYVSGTNWKDQLIITNTGQKTPEQLNRPMKAFIDDVGIKRGLEPGLRPFNGAALSPVITADAGVTWSWGSPTNPDETQSYVWAFHYSYEYKVGNVTYQMDGPVYYTDNLFTNGEIGFSVPATPPAVGSFGIQFNNIPQIDPSNSQIDATNTTIKVYRTVSGGTSFFLLNELPYGTLSFSDNTYEDSAIINNQPLYTNGGILDNYPPPKCKYFTIVNDIPYYGYVVDEDSNEIKPYRVIQGNAGTTDACHPSAYKEVDDEIMGISNVNGFPIVFTRSYIYRLEGSYDNTGGGSIRAKVISEKVGCVGNNTIVRTNNSLFFIGNNGVYVTDGYNVEQVPASKTLFETIQTFILNEDRRSRINSAYDYIEDRIYWSVADNDEENNKWLILNLKTGGFTLADGVTFFSSSLLYKDQALLRGDDLGYIYEHKNGYYSDLIRDISIPASDWQTTAIPWELETVELDYGSPAITKWVSHLNLTVEADTNYAILPVGNNDDERVVRDLKYIRSWGTFYWGDTSFVWGDPDIKWKKQETETHKRHFPRGTMRCRRKQVKLVPAVVSVYKSDAYGLCDVSYLNPTDPLDVVVTLQSGKPFPTDAVGYYMTFEVTGSTRQHKILSTQGNSIIVAGGDITPGIGYKWEIVGEYKNQEVEIKSITTKYAPLANEGREFRSADAGGNA